MIGSCKLDAIVRHCIAPCSLQQAHSIHVGRIKSNREDGDTAILSRLVLRRNCLHLFANEEVEGDDGMQYLQASLVKTVRCVERTAHHNLMSDRSSNKEIIVEKQIYFPL